MAIVDDLLAANVVIQDPDNPDRVIFNVPLFIPKTVIDNNGFALFAKAYGWTETIKNEDNEDVPNTVKDYEKGIQIIQGFAWEVLEAQLIRQAQEQATVAVKTQVEGFKQI